MTSKTIGQTAMSIPLARIMSSIAIKLKPCAAAGFWTGIERQVTLIRNTVKNSIDGMQQTGIDHERGQGGLYWGNHMENLRGPGLKLFHSARGEWVGSGKNIVIGNTIKDSGVGIVLSESQANKVTYNNLEGNLAGFLICNNARDNVVNFNNVSASTAARPLEYRFIDHYCEEGQYPQVQLPSAPLLIATPGKSKKDAFTVDARFNYWTPNS